MSEAIDRLVGVSRERLANTKLADPRDIAKVLVEVSADDLGELVKATPENLEGVPALVRSSFAQGVRDLTTTPERAGRNVSVRPDQVLALAACAAPASVVTEPTSRPAPAINDNDV